MPYRICLKDGQNIELRFFAKKTIDNYRSGNGKTKPTEKVSIAGIDCFMRVKSSS